MHPEKWQNVSKQNRDEAGIKQENIQPGNMKCHVIRMHTREETFKCASSATDAINLLNIRRVSQAIGGLV